MVGLHQLPKPGGEGNEQAIAHRVAVGVIDDLEAVEIDEQHRAGSGGIVLTEQPLQIADHLSPVGQTGQGIVDGLLLRLPPRRPLRRHGPQDLQAHGEAAGHGPQQGALLQIKGLGQPAHHQLFGSLDR